MTRRRESVLGAAALLCSAFMPPHYWADNVFIGMAVTMLVLACEPELEDFWPWP